MEGEERLMKNHFRVGVWPIIVLISLASWGCQSQTPARDSSETFFPILPWELPPWSAGPFSEADHGLDSLHECGFTTAAFVRPQHLRQVEKLGMKCILAAQDFPIPWRKMSDEQIDAAVKKMVDEGKNSPAVMGYFLADEPGEPDFA